jgi:ABC-type lipoprotein export system ATPase subunit
MGASGAGKTTLLNVLACRIGNDKEGKLYANNLEYNY